ncbi:carbamoyl-phosphate synthase large subunit [bacterium]|nr:carbamoyl-phosphate synthase large subunit [bacterium]
MPKRSDIKRILLVGSGPIVIGQACEFDYSGTQACKALKEEGYEVVLVNSNPATIMTDPTLADRTYVEPLTPEVLTKIIEKEKPDAILPTLGGQTALNLAMELHKRGILDAFNVEMIGADAKAIEKAEDRRMFKKAMDKIGLASARSMIAYTMEEARKSAMELGFPCVVRPSFTLGGTGGGIAYNVEELESIVGAGLRSSVISEVLIEESMLGWKEYELEVMRDKNDNAVIICSIENLDPMGVHTGDSITVAPAQTLTDVEYQFLRNASIAILREIGVETGGSNVQFAVNPKDGRVIVIEMNPRVSRSSALASKATGFPIAKFAAKLAVGYTLDELLNDITKKTPACFEPTIDYCVVKIPRFNFEKFPQTSPVLGTAMKSVGEAMSIGRTFKEALQKALRSLETKRFGFGVDGRDFLHVDEEEVLAKLITPNPTRLFYIHHALNNGYTVEQICDYTKIDPWFVIQMAQLVDFSKTISKSPESFRKAKEWGFSDVQIAHLLGLSESEVRHLRQGWGILPTYKLVDTCAAEFESVTPYFYSTYEQEDESRITPKEKVMILGGGPNRIGQGIEFDYCCVHASFSIREEGLESIMVNSNPETVSTDYDISDKLYFEPLTFEDVLNIYEREKPRGVIVQFGGQTPLNLSVKLEQAGVKVLGTSSASIDMAEDREKFQAMISRLGLVQPKNGTVVSLEDAIRVANLIGYPVLARPSYVLGGASMEIVYSDAELETYMKGSHVEISNERPLLIDQYLEDATEVDVDALSDGSDVIIAGVMEHIEEAGVHSGDSACSLPPHSLSSELVDAIKTATIKLAIELKVVGLMNIQFAVKDNTVYVLEVNPRASRTVPFVSKATGVPWAKMATKVILGKKIKDLGIVSPVVTHTAVKEAVFPFNKFPGVDILLGPEMKSTGEVMGLDQSFGMAFLKAQLAAGQQIPTSGKVFISVKNPDKPKIVELASIFKSLGFELVATQGTARFLAGFGIESETIYKVYEGRPNIVDAIKNGEIQLIVNTASGKNPMKDEVIIRQTALQLNVPVITTVAGAAATARAIGGLAQRKMEVNCLQAYFH